MSRFSGKMSVDSKKGTRHNKGVMRRYKERKREEAEARNRSAELVPECGHRHTLKGAVNCPKRQANDRPMVGTP